MIGEVGQRIAESREFPVNQGHRARLDRVENQIVEPEVAMNDGGRARLRQMLRQPVNQPVHGLDRLSFRRQILSPPTRHLSLEIAPGATIVGKANGRRIDAVQRRNDAVHLIEEGAAIFARQIRQGRIPEGPALDVRHDEECGSDKSWIVAVAQYAWNRHIRARKGAHHAILAVDRMGGRQERSVRPLAQNVVAVGRGEEEGRV